MVKIVNMPDKKRQGYTSYYEDPIITDDDFACIDDDMSCHECHYPDDCNNCPLDCDRYDGMTAAERLDMRLEDDIAARFVSLLKSDGYTITMQRCREEL